MAYSKVIQKVKDLISAISTLTPTPPPVGGIIDYYGALDSSGKYPMTSDGHINYNWHVCDGTDGTPNLVGKTVIGASKATYGNEGGSDTVTPSVTVNSATQSVSVNGHTLTTAEMPSHTHGWSKRYWMASGIGSLVVNDQNFDAILATDNAVDGVEARASFVEATGGSGSHSHGITTSAHTHSLTISSFDNRSSFKALYKIMRLA